MLEHSIGEGGIEQWKQAGMKGEPEEPDRGPERTVYRRCVSLEADEMTAPDAKSASVQGARTRARVCRRVEETPESDHSDETRHAAATATPAARPERHRTKGMQTSAGPTRRRTHSCACA